MDFGEYVFQLRDPSQLGACVRYLHAFALIPALYISFSSFLLTGATIFNSLFYIPVVTLSPKPDVF